MRDPSASGLFAPETASRTMAVPTFRRLRQLGGRVTGRGGPLRGPFNDWNEAVERASGYEQPIILKRLMAAAEQSASSGGQKFDRDGVVFEKPITPFALLTYILTSHRRIPDRLRVLDFGGGLGSTFRQCRPFLTQFAQVRWSVVEQAHVAAAGRLQFQTDDLDFYENISDAAGDDAPDVIIFSSVLQYLADPYGVLDQAQCLGPRTILIDRTPFSEKSEDNYGVQVVDEAIFPARLPFRIFGIDRLEDALRPRYRKTGEFDAIDQSMSLGKISVKFKGLGFRPAVGDTGSNHVL
jgi:putative methyltransferase (TIGR04325 family)